MGKPMDCYGLFGLLTSLKVLSVSLLPYVIELHGLIKNMPGLNEVVVGQNNCFGVVLRYKKTGYD